MIYLNIAFSGIKLTKTKKIYKWSFNPVFEIIIFHGAMITSIIEDILVFFEKDRTGRSYVRGLHDGFWASLVTSIACFFQKEITTRDGIFYSHVTGET